jgi:hypothetical protein
MKLVLLVIKTQRKEEMGICEAEKGGTKLSYIDKFKGTIQTNVEEVFV